MRLNNWVYTAAYCTCIAGPSSCKRMQEKALSEIAGQSSAYVTVVPYCSRSRLPLAPVTEQKAG